ncbi:hypothetical protein RDABS01_010097 [Bienertia sinuspersici]
MESGGINFGVFVGLYGRLVIAGIFLIPLKGLGWRLSKAVGAIGAYCKVVKGLKDDGLVGLCAIVRDEMSDVLVAMTDVVKGIFLVEVCEVLALRRGLQITIEVGFKWLTVETDCLVLVETIKRKKRWLLTALPSSVLVGVVCVWLEDCPAEVQ